MQTTWYLRTKVPGLGRGKYLLLKDDGPVVWRKQGLLQKVMQLVVNLEKNKEENVLP